MKKLVVFLAMALFLAVPLSANAAVLGWGDLNVTHSGPTGGGYYLDYDGEVVSSNFGYTTALEEVFCVSGENGYGGNYDFYTITADLQNFSQLSQAAWIADNWTTWGTDDTTKGEAQKAVWEVMNVMHILEGVGTDYNIYLASQGHSGYLTTGWYWAHSPSFYDDGDINCEIDYQDYLTPVPPGQVPEPATLLLLGLGLIGLGAYRKYQA